MFMVGVGVRSQHDLIYSLDITSLIMATREDTRARLRPFGIVFEKSLHDLIRGIRASKDPTAREGFLRDALADCRNEVRSPDMEIKTMAILKLAYLEMYGFDMSWASFHVLEVMSSARFQQKRVGYLAAIQSFRSDTEVLMLTTNLLKKDLGSAHPLEVSVALSGVSSIVTPSLAQDISDDIVKMLNHSKPYIRKKAVLAMYRIFLQYPEALRTSFQRLKDKLEDPDPSVVSATVNVICELAKQTTSSSKTFLALAPQLYELLTTSNNNWMIIKILKLFSSLAPTEPRLKPKLLPPILQLIDSTSAMSLLYECINCILCGGMLDESDYELARMCVGKLRTFLEQTDQNLKYVGLLAFSKVVKIHPQFIGDHEDVVLECIDDADLTIREKVLEMLSGLVNEDNLYSIVMKLMDQLKANTDEHSQSASFVLPKAYRVLVINKIMELCSKNTYEYIPDFEWFTNILVELVDLADGFDEVGQEIGRQLRNVSVRVRSVRDITVGSATQIITNQRSIPSVLPYAVWIVGEYASFLQYPSQLIESITTLDNVDDDLLKADSIQAIMKIYASWAGKEGVEWTPQRSSLIKSCTEMITKYLERHSTAASFEVQERAVEFLELIKLTAQAIDEHPMGESNPPLFLTLAIPSMFNQYELNPVARSAQRKIQTPPDLDLDTPIYPRCDYHNSNLEDLTIDESDEEPQSNTPETVNDDEWKAGGSNNGSGELTEEEMQRKKMERIERQKDDPFYISIPSTTNQTPAGSRSDTPAQGEDLIGQSASPGGATAFMKRPKKKKVEIIQDEKIGDDDEEEEEPAKQPKKSSRLHSKLRELNLEEDNPETAQQDVADIAQLRSEMLNAKTASETVEVTHKKIKKKSGEKKKKKSSTNPDEKKKKKKSSKKPVDDQSPSDQQQPLT
jgi:AP-3 complex subunit delta-1